ncbi:hypothetical protein D3C81_979360 [compost metagenome]
MPTVPNSTTVATATAVWRSSVRTTDDTAMAAAAPQMALPELTRIASRRLSPKKVVPTQVPNSSVATSIVSGTTMPGRPSATMDANVSRSPYSATPSRSR